MTSEFWGQGHCFTHLHQGKKLSCCPAKSLNDEERLGEDVPGEECGTKVSMGRLVQILKRAEGFILLQQYMEQGCCIAQGMYFLNLHAMFGFVLSHEGKRGHLTGLWIRSPSVNGRPPSSHLGFLVLLQAINSTS